jgi:hypothetical protein
MPVIVFSSMDCEPQDCMGSPLSQQQLYCGLLSDLAVQASIAPKKPLARIRSSVCRVGSHVLQMKDMVRRLKHQHPQSLREKVFQIWLHNDQNASQTARVTKNRLNVEVSIPTITRWRDQFDWEGKAAVYHNELQRMFRMSDDPVLQQLAMDDIETARVLTEIQHIMREVIRHPKKYNMFPKNVGEAIALLKFSREERERILKKTPQTAPVQPNQGAVHYYDQRKIEVRGEFEKLPPGDQRMIIDSVSSVRGIGLKAAKHARREAFDDQDEVVDDD